MNLYNHQKEGVNFLISHPRCILADEMGLGKTLQAIYAAGWLVKKTRAASILVICPASLQRNWLAEIEKFSELRGKILKGKDISPESRAFNIISYASAKKLIAEIAQLDVIICDESHYIKNFYSQRTMVVRQLTKKAEYVWLLTGTPIANTPNDMFVPLNIVDAKNFPNFLRFAYNYLNWEVKKIYTKKGVIEKKEYTGFKKENLYVFKSLLKNIMLRRLKSDVIDLPDKIFQDFNFKTNFNFQDVAKQLTDLHRIDVVLNAFFETDKTFFQNLREHSLEKAEAALSTYRNAIEQNDKIVIFCKYLDTAKYLFNNLPDCVIFTGEQTAQQKSAAVSAFQNSDKKVFIGTIQAAGTGITLTAASHLFFHDLDFTPASILQATDRIHRIGQKNAANIYFMLSGALDYKIKKALEAKQDTIKQLYR